MTAFVAAFDVQVHRIVESCLAGTNRICNLHRRKKRWRSG